MSFLNGLLGRLWGGLQSEQPPQLPDDKRSIWIYAQPSVETPTNLVLLAEYDNNTGYFTLTRAIMDQAEKRLRPPTPFADQPHAMCDRATLLRTFDALAHFPQNVTVKPEDNPPFSVHFNQYRQELAHAFGASQKLAL